MLFNFQRQGLVMVAGEAAQEDAVFEAAMEAGAADIQQALDEDGKVVGFKVGGLPGWLPSAARPPRCHLPAAGLSRCQTVHRLLSAVITAVRLAGCG